MATHRSRWSWQRSTVLIIFGSLIALSIGTVSFGQKQAPGDTPPELLPKPDELDGSYEVVSSGYVRPGDLSDMKANGQIVSLAKNPDQKTDVLGGTVYFAVLKRKQPSGWGLDLDKRFVRGDKSPAKLDADAEYIYLFQVVNDRGLEKGGAVPAVDQEIQNEPISSFALGLQVPTEKITSWGYFENTGFVLSVPHKDQQESILLSASGNDAVVGHLEPGYFRNAGIKPFENWTIGSASHQLKNSKQIEELEKKKKAKGAKLAAHEENLLKASQSAHNPVSVEVLYSDAKEMGAFRVDFASRTVKGKGSPLALGEHSPMFGFTSNRPPKRDARIRLEDAKAAEQSDGIAMAADAKSGIALTTQLMPTPAADTPDLGPSFFAGLQNTVDEFVGYTAPGYPSDAVIAKGKQRIDAIGATVYFAVLKLTGDRGDTWGTGTANFDGLFYNGQSFQNKQSPALDTKARYLYLYQLVNDRDIVNTNRAPGTKLALAADGDDPDKLNIVPVAAMGIELEVDPRAITSWGHFRHTGFTFGVPDMKFKKEKAPKGTGILTIADTGADASRIQLAASSMPPLLLQFPEKRYRPDSPPISLGKLRSSFNIGSATENLTQTSYYREVANIKKQGGGIKLAGWQESLLAADKGDESTIVREPAHVQLLYRGYDDESLPGVIRPNIGVIRPTAAFDADARTVFRVDWWRRDAAKVKQTSLVEQGTHGPIVGFTSDLPPKWGGMWIENMAAATLGIRETGGLAPAVPAVPGATPAANVRTVGDLGIALTAGPSAVALAATPGAVPDVAVPVAVPVPDATATPAAVGGTPVVGGLATPPAGGLGGVPGGGGGGGVPAGGFGGVGSVPGGGFGGGFGGGNGGGQGEGEGDTGADAGQDQDADQQGQQVINFNALLINQQAQAQLQKQQQKQKQKQKQNGGGNGNGDVPEPAVILLGLLGLPVLFFLRRRRHAVSATA